MYDLLLYWIITIIVEFIVIWLFIRSEPLKLFFYSILINSITLPLATFSYIYIFHYFLIIEIGVLIVEMIFLKFLLEVRYSMAFIISLAGNLITGILGYIIQMF